MRDTTVELKQLRLHGMAAAWGDLLDRGVKISEKVVRRLMKQECLVAATSKRRRYGSTIGEISPACIRIVAATIDG